MWLVDARKTSLTGVQNSQKNRLAATAARTSPVHRKNAIMPLVDARKTSLTGLKIAQKKSARRFAARGRCSASSLGQTPPPPWKKARSAPVISCILNGLQNGIPQWALYHNIHSGELEEKNSA